MQGVRKIRFENKAFPTTVLTVSGSLGLSQPPIIQWKYPRLLINIYIITVFLSALFQITYSNIFPLKKFYLS